MRVLGDSPIRTRDSAERAPCHPPGGRQSVLVMSSTPCSSETPFKMTSGWPRSTPNPSSVPRPSYPIAPAPGTPIAPAPGLPVAPLPGMPIVPPPGMALPPAGEYAQNPAARIPAMTGIAVVPVTGNLDEGGAANQRRIIRTPRPGPPGTRLERAPDGPELSGRVVNAFGRHNREQPVSE